MADTDKRRRRRRRTDSRRGLKSSGKVNRTSHKARPFNRPIRHRNNPLLPKRPKKAPTGYITFVSEYFRKNRPKDAKDSKQVMCAAAKAWGKLSGSERRTYEKRCDKHRVRQQEAMAKWRRQRNALKKPPSGYALFLRDVWKNEDKIRTFVEMSRHAADLWKELKDSRKQMLERRHKVAVKNHNGLMEQLKAGKLSVEDLGKEPEAPAPTAGDGAQGENRKRKAARRPSGEARRRRRSPSEGRRRRRSPSGGRRRRRSPSGGRRRRSPSGGRRRRSPTGGRRRRSPSGGRRRRRSPSGGRRRRRSPSGGRRRRRSPSGGRRGAKSGQ